MNNFLTSEIIKVIFRHPRLSSLFVTLIFKPILLFLLSIKRWPLNKNLSELLALMHDMYLTSQFMKLLRKQYRPSILDSYKVSINSTKKHMHFCVENVKVWIKNCQHVTDYINVELQCLTRLTWLVHTSFLPSNWNLDKFFAPTG